MIHSIGLDTRAWVAGLNFFLCVISEVTIFVLQPTSYVAGFFFWFFFFTWKI